MTSEFDAARLIKETVIKKLTEIALKKISSFIKKTNKKPIEQGKIIAGFEDKIVSHFNELYNWSQEIEYVGLSQPISVLKNTIGLTFYFSVSREDRRMQNDNTYEEKDILKNKENIVIEGDPGSGKTTTLKRLLSNYFFSQNNKSSEFLFPVLIRLRAIEKNETLYTYICDILGISYATKVREVVVFKDKISTRIEYGRKIEEKTKEKVIEKKIYYQVNDINIEVYVADIFEKNKVLLIMDGLDELKPQLMDDFQKEIKNLCLRLSQSKIIITSRPNYIKSIFPNVLFFQIKELLPKQMEIISKLWLNDYKDFLEQLKKKSYYELANRPLFLSFLILLFRNQMDPSKKVLPKSSKDVYRQLMDLLIKKWDKERDIVRSSKYAYFDPSKKIEFLSHLSFRLTYIIKKKEFTHEHLVQAYKLICEHFDLPINEASQVAEEIENHTGIIIKSFYDKYEFSHLAIQEYLCAEYIVSGPLDENINGYMEEYPAPLAIAINLSSDSGAWFYQLVLHSKFLYNYEKSTLPFSQLLDRLVVEAPYFGISEKLAMAVMLICRFCNLNDKKFLQNLKRFVKSNNNIEKSIRLFLGKCTIWDEERQNNQIIYKIKNSSEIRDSNLYGLPLNPQLIK